MDVLRLPASSIVAVVTGISVPFVVYFGATAWPESWTRTAFLLLGTAWGFLALVARARRREAWGLGLSAVLAFSISFASGSDVRELLFLSFPSVMSLGVMTLFAQSLRRGQTPLIEQIARRTPKYRDGATVMPESGVVHCRRFTVVWAIALLTNGLIAAILAVAAGREVWALYCCVLSYVLLAIVFLTEWSLRPRTGTTP